MRQTILIVDDDPVSLRILQYNVGKLAPTYPLMTAVNGQEALARIAARPITLLITDYWLPDMDGIDLTTAVKAASPETHVVLTSIDDSPALKQRAREHAVDQFLLKMDLLAQLSEVMRAVLPAD